MKKEKFLNTYINNITMNDAINNIDQWIKTNEKKYIVAINVDVVMKIENDNELKQITNDADLTLVDGKPLIWIGKMHKLKIKEKISGSDLVPKLCELAAERNYSIYLLGGKAEVSKKAEMELKKKYPKINIVGTYSPPYGFENDEKELDKINNNISKLKPDILIVCFGCPKQEKWIYHNIKKYNAKISICAGATIDFLANNVKRAPKWMSNIGLEWFYRFLQEPKRLFKRYFVDDIKIIKLIWKYK